MTGIIRYHPLTRWSLTLAWTVLVLMLMFSPSGDGTTVTWISRLFGGTEITDAIGHVILNSILALLWCWTLSLYLPVSSVIRYVLVGGAVWCFGSELVQAFVPERGTSVLDLGANLLGIMVGVQIYRRLINR